MDGPLRKLIWSTPISHCGVGDFSEVFRHCPPPLLSVANLYCGGFRVANVRGFQVAITLTAMRGMDRACHDRHAILDDRRSLTQKPPSFGFSNDVTAANLAALSCKAEGFTLSPSRLEHSLPASIFSCVAAMRVDYDAGSSFISDSIGERANRFEVTLKSGQSKGRSSVSVSADLCNRVWLRPVSLAKVCVSPIKHL